MVDADEPTAQIERHTDRIEPEQLGVGVMRALAQPAPSHPADLGSLERADRVEGAATTRSQPSRLDFAEGERSAVEGDDVEFSPASSVVALDDFEASPDQVLGGELLTSLSQPVAGISAHRDGPRWPHDGRYAAASYGWVTRRASSAVARGQIDTDLAQPVTHP